MQHPVQSARIDDQPTPSDNHGSDQGGILATIQGVDGTLGLQFRRLADGDGAITVVDTLEQRPPLRMIRAFSQPDGSALAHLHNISGGVLGGDQLSVSVALEADASAQVTTTGATRVYRHRPGRPDATQVTRFLVGPGALLEYLPDSLIPYAGARYRQVTEFHLVGDAGVMAWDVITPGREARGETFHYDQLSVENLVMVDGEPILIERQVLAPSTRPVTVPARMGHYRTQASLLICRGGWSPTAWSRLEGLLQDLAAERSVDRQVVWGASTLVCDGILVRGLAMEGRSLVEALPDFWRLAKREIYGLDGVLPRKIY